MRQLFTFTLLCLLCLPSFAMRAPWKDYALDLPSEVRNLRTLVEATPIRSHLDPIQWKHIKEFPDLSCARVRLPASSLTDDTPLTWDNIHNSPNSHHPHHQIFVTLLTRHRPDLITTPTLVVGHGSTGQGPLQYSEAFWALYMDRERWQEPHFNVVLVDQYQGRGIEHTLSDQSVLSNMAAMKDFSDVHAFLYNLGVRRPHIITDSRGALATMMYRPELAPFFCRVPLYSTRDRRISAEDAARIEIESSAHIFPLNLGFEPEPHINSPLLVLHGTSDDIVPHHISELYINMLQEAGYNYASLIRYDDATHAFAISDESAFLLWLGNRLCPRESDGRVKHGLKWLAGKALALMGKPNTLAEIQSYHGDPIPYLLPHRRRATANDPSTSAASPTPDDDFDERMDILPVASLAEVKDRVLKGTRARGVRVQAHPVAAQKLETDLQDYWRHILSHRATRMGLSQTRPPLRSHQDPDPELSEEAVSLLSERAQRHKIAAVGPSPRRGEVDRRDIYAFESAAHGRKVYLFNQQPAEALVLDLYDQVLADIRSSRRPELAHVVSPISDITAGMIGYYSPVKNRVVYLWENEGLPLRYLLQQGQKRVHFPAIAWNDESAMLLTNPVLECIHHMGYVPLPFKDVAHWGNDPENRPALYVYVAHRPTFQTGWLALYQAHSNAADMTYIEEEEEEEEGDAYENAERFRDHSSEIDEDDARHIATALGEDEEENEDEDEDEDEDEYEKALRLRHQASEIIDEDATSSRHSGMGAQTPADTASVTSSWRSSFHTFYSSAKSSLKSLATRLLGGKSSTSSNAAPSAAAAASSAAAAAVRSAGELGEVGLSIAHPKPTKMGHSTSGSGASTSGSGFGEQTVVDDSEHEDALSRTTSEGSSSDDRLDMKDPERG